MLQGSEMMKLWLDQESLDEVLRKELLGIDDPEEIKDRFYRDLEFGTGGLRGILGAGINRMNIYTVRKATQGFADYINLHYGLESDGNARTIPADTGTVYGVTEPAPENGVLAPAVAVAYDSRINSRLFAEEAAGVFAANGIKTYLYTELMPTPALSFAVRHFKCCAGIMITASHNPSKYNGYKAYNDEGCQLTLDAAAEVLSFIEKIDIFKDVKTIASGTDLSSSPLIQLISEDVAQAYLDAVLKESTGIDCSNLSVVYSPLNGTGNVPVRQVMEQIGVKQIHIVKEQELPDGNFPTCPYPNPEKKEALALGLELCRRLSEAGGAPDILLATDPDCDRVGVAVRHSAGDDKPGGCDRGSSGGSTVNGGGGTDTAEEYHLITGNEIGILLLDFICTVRGEAAGYNGAARSVKPMPKDPVAIKTIVTSKMAESVAKNYGVTMIDVLTGFKFIGEQIGILEEKGEEGRYIFGFEESYGYLSGAYVRDKDAVNGAMLICEMTAYYKKSGKTLIDRRNELYQKYGYYKNDLMEFAFEGAAGMEKMSTIMSRLRNDPPGRIIGREVTEIADYHLSHRKSPGRSKDGELTSAIAIIDLPKSDVLEYVLEDGSSIVVRPSGTEPKLKIYLSAKGESREESEGIIEKLKNELSDMIRVNH